MFPRSQSLDGAKGLHNGKTESRFSNDTNEAGKK